MIDARALWRCLGLALLLLAGGCDYPIRNQEAAVIDERAGYRWQNLTHAPPEDTLVIVTASGGGTRATALALSVLRGLDAVRLPDGRSLAEKVDLISSVSGGSVAAGYFALQGRAGFSRLERDFIRQDGIGALVTGLLNPLNLVRLTTPSEERIDFLIDYLRKQLFADASYQTLLDHRHGPFLLLNAADMVEGVPFSFTQRKMDLLCSDLARLDLATAVAASAAFPVALSPVTLKNYSPCALTPPKNWPPAWVRGPLDSPQFPTRWHDNPQRTTLARVEAAYARGDAPDPNDPAASRKRFIHLLDGGIADNLGVFEPFRMLTTTDTQPSFLTDIGAGRIKKLIFVAINARSFKPSALDSQQATPGVVDMLSASIGAPIDRASSGSSALLRKLLMDEFRQIELGSHALAARVRALAENTALVSIDFDAILDVACRRKYHSIPTSWSLEKQQIDALMVVGGALLASDPQFAKLLQLVAGAVSSPLPSVAEACAAL